MKSPLSKLDVIRACAKALSIARSKLSKSVAALTAKVDAAHRKHVPTIRKNVGEVADAEAMLRAALNKAPELFVQPRTITESGIKCGFQGHDASLEIPSKLAERNAFLLELHKMFSAGQREAFQLTTWQEVPNPEKILEHCNAAQIEQLVKAGAVFTPAGDHVIVKPADAAVDKLVAKLLKAASDSAKEEDAA